MDDWTMPEIKTITTVFDYDWTKEERGTCIVVESLSKRFPPRHDGLCELEFLRIKRADGYPVFCIKGDEKRKPCSWIPYEFAFSRDGESVRRFAEKIVAEAVEQLAKVAERTKEAAERKEREAEKRRVAIAAVRADHQTKADSLGMTLEQFEDSIRLWNQIRNNSFRPKSCFVCGRRLVDPVSIATGIGPECSRRIGEITQVARATQADWIGKMRFDADRLVARLKRAGLVDMLSELESMLYEDARPGQ